MAIQPGCTPVRQYVGNGFKVGANYLRPGAPVAGAWIDIDDPRVKSDPPADCAWWTVFNDPTLDGLIDQAYRQNLDLRSAGTRIVEARARRGIAVGSLFPQQQSADVTYLHAQISENLAIPFPTQFNLWAAGFNGSWELDFWGRYRRSIEAADATLQASVEGYGEVLVLLLSDVASNYIELRTYQQRLAYAEMNVEIQKGSLKLAEARFTRGASTELDVRQARSSLQRTQAVVPTYQASAREAANALCVLLAMPPNDLAEALGPAPIPTAPVEVALGVPADLLARRPDVRRAERAVAEQSARLGIAQTDMYPSLTLNGYMGFMSNDIEQLFESTSFTGYILPQFSWNVLNYGRISNNIIAQDARLQGVAFDYQQTVLKAGKEVEDSLTRFLHAQQRAKFLRGSVADAKRAVELAELQFKGGTTDFNRVYNLQSLLAQQQDELAAVEGSIALNLVAVYKSLGGGWRCFLYCQGLPAPNYNTQSTPAKDGDPATNEGPEPLPAPIPIMPDQSAPDDLTLAAKKPGDARTSKRRVPKTEGQVATAAKPMAESPKPFAQRPEGATDTVGADNPFMRTAPKQPGMIAKETNAKALVSQQELAAKKDVAGKQELVVKKRTELKDPRVADEPAATPKVQAKKSRPQIGIGQLFARKQPLAKETATNTEAVTAAQRPSPPPLPRPAPVVLPMESAKLATTAVTPETAGKTTTPTKTAASDPRPSSRRVVRESEPKITQPAAKPYQHKPLELTVERPSKQLESSVANRTAAIRTATNQTAPNLTGDRRLAQPSTEAAAPTAAAAEPRPSSRRVVTAEERQAGKHAATSQTSQPAAQVAPTAAHRPHDPRPSSRRVVPAEERLSGKPRPHFDQHEALDRSPQSVPKTTVGNHNPRLASQAGYEGGVGVVERN